MGLTFEPPQFLKVGRGVIWEQITTSEHVSLFKPRLRCSLYRTICNEDIFILSVSERVRVPDMTPFHLHTLGYGPWPYLLSKMS
jgi:hypothetical protein